MGNYVSTQNDIDYGDKTCLICWDNIEYIDLIICIKCNICLHAYCEETYRGTIGYCKCPHCQRIGTLST
jgi:hypothetical protein